MNPRPLQDKRVLLTRARGQSEQLRGLLEERGAQVLEIPLIEVVALEDPALRKALPALDSYHWVLLTSKNAVRFFLRALRRGGKAVPSVPMAAVGPGTAAALRGEGIEPALVASTHRAEGLFADLTRTVESGLSEKRFLLPSAALARPYLADQIRAAGGLADVVPLYDTVAPESSRSALLELLRDNPPDWIALTSSSTARHLREFLGDAPLPPSVSLACIGEITAETARGLNLPVGAVARESSLPGLVEAIVEASGK